MCNYNLCFICCHFKYKGAGNIIYVLSFCIFHHTYIVCCDDKSYIVILIKLDEQVHQLTRSDGVQIGGRVICQHQRSFLTMARATVTRCCCPPERCAGRRSSIPARPTSLIILCERKERSPAMALTLYLPQNSLTKDSLIGLAVRLQG